MARTKANAKTRVAQNFRNVPNIHKSYKNKNGSKAMKEIKYLQKTTHMLICKLSFRKVIRSVMLELNKPLKLQKEAVHLLQDVTESYLVGLFADARICCHFGKRKEVTKKDMRLAMYFRKELTTYSEE